MTDRKRKAVERAAAWSKANPDRRKKNANAYYWRNKDVVAARRKMRAAEAAANKPPKPPREKKIPNEDELEQRRLKQRRARARNREARREQARKDREGDPERYRNYCRNARARRAAAEGSFTCEDLASIRRSQNDRCVYCSSVLNGAGEVDHIVAISKGGSNWPSNIQLTCRGCNRRKHSKSSDEFTRLQTFQLFEGP